MSRNPWCPPNPQCHSPISWQECRLLQHQQRKPRRRKIGNGSVILCSKTNSFKSLVSGIEKDSPLSLSFIYWCHCWLENIDNLFLKEHFKRVSCCFLLYIVRGHVQWVHVLYHPACKPSGKCIPFSWLSCVGLPLHVL